MIIPITLADLLEDGVLDGYRPYAPSGAVAGVDAECAALATCDACGQEGCHYRGYSRPGSYLAYAICPRCGHAMEF